MLVPLRLDERMIFIRTVSEKVPLPDSMIHDLLTKPREEKQPCHRHGQKDHLQHVA